jgi:phage FluMu gp28-like protein
MGWSVHTVPLQKAVEQGLVEKINEKSSRSESREEFLARVRSECIDEEQWLQEYCCIPADESSAFFSYEMLNACEERNLRLMSFEELQCSLSAAGGEGQGEVACSHDSSNPTIHQSSLYIGCDVARRNNLCVIDVGEKIGDVVWDRMRIELQNKTFAEIEFELFRLLRLSQVKRACIDATGMGMQLAERARERFGWKVEALTFTPAAKEELAFGLRRDLEERKIRIVADDNLRTDLRALKKEVTVAGNIRFAGETENSHCDRTWAKALRQHAARARSQIGAMVG